MDGTATTRSLSRRVVLLARRNDDNRAMYAEYFRDQGFTVIAAAHAEDALRLAAQADVVVTGLQLSGMTGAELIARLRQNAATRDTPIVVVTANVFAAHRASAEASGCDVFLPMPCVPDDLLRQVWRLLRRRPGSGSRHRTTYQLF